MILKCENMVTNKLKNQPPVIPRKKRKIPKMSKKLKTLAYWLELTLLLTKQVRNIDK